MIPTIHSQSRAAAPGVPGVVRSRIEKQRNRAAGCFWSSGGGGGGLLRSDFASSSSCQQPQLRTSSPFSPLDPLWEGEGPGPRKGVVWTSLQDNSQQPGHRT